MPKSIALQKSDALVLILLAALITLQFMRSELNVDLAYTRDGLASGQYWRLLSGHFAHTNWPHLLLNLPVLALFYSLVRGQAAAFSALCVLPVIAIISSLILYTCYPGLSWYYGLSGALHGFGVLTATALISARATVGWPLLALLTAKIAWEQSPVYSDAAIATVINTRVATEAHLSGAIAAAVLLAIFFIAEYFRRK